MAKKHKRFVKTFVVILIWYEIVFPSEEQSSFLPHFNFDIFFMDRKLPGGFKKTFTS